MQRISAHHSDLRIGLVVFVACLYFAAPHPSLGSQSPETLTPIQRQIQTERERLSSSSDEERRDALMRLGAMHVGEASRAALAGLTDPSIMVRAIAAKAVLSLPVTESVPALLPLLNDKNEFVRREAAYALGLTGSKAATSALVDHLLNDKEDGVRAAAAVALGQIADETSVVTLATVLTGQAKRKGKQEKNEFVLRAVATALGRTGSPAGVPALITALMNEKLAGDVRREAAASLGSIGDRSAIDALTRAANSSDPYLAHIAFQSLKKISR